MSTLLPFSLGKLSFTTPFPAISIPGTRLLSAFGPPVLVGMGYYLGTRIGFAWTPPVSRIQLFGHRTQFCWHACFWLRGDDGGHFFWRSSRLTCSLNYKRECRSRPR